MKQLEMLYEGKAKQVFRTDDDDVILMHYKDAATAFNNIKKATIEGKGVLNNKISTIIFGYLKEAGIPTHYISTLNERDQLCRRVKIIPLEVIVRNIVAGSMAKRLGLEEGLRPSNTIYDICYKCDELGDPLINDHHAVALGVVTYDELKRIYDMTAKINEVLTGRPHEHHAGGLQDRVRPHVGRADRAGGRSVARHLPSVGQDDQREARQGPFPSRPGARARGLRGDSRPFGGFEKIEERHGGGGFPLRFSFSD